VLSDGNATLGRLSKRRLYRDRSGVYHATRRCSKLPPSAELVACSYEDVPGCRYTRCEACVPIPIFAPKKGATDHRVYHAVMTCRSVPRDLRYPIPRYDWVWWPSCEYERTINEDVRCTLCIPDRVRLYPLRRGREGRHRRSAA
jgi:hypothetical protein